MNRPRELCPGILDLTVAGPAVRARGTCKSRARIMYEVSRAVSVGVTLVAVLTISSASADMVDLASGTVNSAPFGTQTGFFSNTRAVDVTVLGNEDIEISSMTLGLVNIGGPAVVYARIWDNAGTIVVSADVVPAPAPPVQRDVVVPITATLNAGSTYRLGFSVIEPCCNTGTWIVDPAPTGAGGFGYTTTIDTCSIRVDAAYDSPGDGGGLGPIRPTDPSIHMPLISVELANPLCTPTLNDTDGDGIADSADNCPLIPNANFCRPPGYACPAPFCDDQEDGDGDLFGNACDADFVDPPNLVTGADFTALLANATRDPVTQQLPPLDLAIDLDCNGKINLGDREIFKRMYFQAPGNVWISPNYP
jgi:hypothetical protein